MKHKGQGMQFLHPGDLKRYYKEKNFKWDDIRKILYYPEEMAEQMEAEKQMQKEIVKSKADIDEQPLEITKEELKEIIDEYLDDDHLFEKVKEIINQKKVQRIVINLPKWQKDQSMNALVRLALTEYLSKK